MSFLLKKKKKRPDTQTELEHSRKARNVLLPLVALRVIVDISTSETLWKVCAAKKRKEKTVLARGCDGVWLILCSYVMVTRTSESKGLWTSFRQQSVINHCRPGVIWVYVGLIQAWQIHTSSLTFHLKNEKFTTLPTVAHERMLTVDLRSLLSIKWTIVRG